MKMSKVLAASGGLLFLLTAVSTTAENEAARFSDYHICPAVTGLVPHVGGPINNGDQTVLICGLPAARAGDQAICVGPPDTISAGSSTVRIGGLPAARLGDNTAHGGTITGGCATVKIGG